MDVNKKYVLICHGVSYLFNITFTVQFGKLIEFSKKKLHPLDQHKVLASHNRNIVIQHLDDIAIPSIGITNR